MVHVRRFFFLFLTGLIPMTVVFGMNNETSSTMKLTSKKAIAFDKVCAADLQAARDRFEALETLKEPASVASVLVPLNELGIVMDRNMNRASVYQSVNPDPEVRDVAAKWEQEYSKLETEINLSRPLYDAVASIDVSNSDAPTRRWVNKLLDDFRRAGVDKDEATRGKIRQLKEELVKITQEFGKNIREDVREIKLDSPDEMAGLPGDFIKSHQPGADGKITITTDYPDYLPFISYAKSDSRRLELYRAFRRRGYPQNEKVMEQMLQKRYELAQLLGYKNYAQYVTENKMIRNPQAASDFIEKVSNAASRRAEHDYQELLQRLQKEVPGATEVGDWQKTYISDLVKREAYDFDAQSLRQYFAYDRVRDGLFDITGKLFNVSYKKVNIPVWDPSVEAYEIYADGELIGRFYLDMHPRKDKYKHAMMTQIVTGVKGVQLPEAALVCNFPGGDGTPGLMEHDQVETFFHEFGHLLHHIFAGRQPWIGISGISTEWDFVETPSNLLQEWAWDPAILKMFAKNENGETIPDELINKMIRARDFGLGLFARQQMFYAAVSLNFYNRSYQDFDPLEMVKKLQAKYTPFGYVDGTYMHLAFGHLDEYSAIYYTYMWSTVIAKDLFSRFREEGMLNTQVATAYRDKVLAPGGSEDAAVMVRNFLGRDYSFDAFEKWMNEI